MEKRTVSGIYVPTTLWMCGLCRNGMEVSECSMLCELDPGEKVIKHINASCDYFDISEQELQYYKDGLKDDGRGIEDSGLSGIVRD